MQMHPNENQEQQLPPPPALPPDERAQRIAALADGKLFTRLAPIVDRLAARPGPSAILDAPPAGIPLRLDTRKALAFDGDLSVPVAVALVLVIVVWAHAIACITEFASHDKWWLHVAAVTAGVVALFITIGIFVACASYPPSRIRALRAVVARSAVVPGRIVAATLMRGRKGVRLGVNVTVDYGYAGAWHRTAMYVFDPAAYALLGPTPEILFNPTRPEQTLFKDLYI